jgi:hypothetical protein
MTPEVEAAVADLKEAFPGHRVDVDPEPQGGAYVIVHDLPLGAQYRPERSWVGFVIPYTYPHSDVYPLFADPALARADGAALGQAFQRVEWRGRPATQISRRSNRWSPAHDTAAVKLRKVLSWVAGQ